MLFGDNRDELRQMYADAWQKYLDGQILTPLEEQISRVVEEHPEYHDTVASSEQDTEYTPEGGASNPYLHMGLHLAIREQVGTDRPPGIHSIFGKLATLTGDHLEAEHRMLECLAETLWESQRDNAPPDEQAYIDRLRTITK